MKVIQRQFQKVDRVGYMVVDLWCICTRFHCFFLSSNW
ncbi:hypothetical protein H5410_020782 [Solanum commersonii]|uniref:Uncharacterized protein n=1 Tax=Solanum commersonii TaxID=4109 RepID=A0A9J5ZAW8_SOLCO|nr:hypothetical protein H5410_020782 [Solanum commersonii]